MRRRGFFAALLGLPVAGAAAVARRSQYAEREATRGVLSVNEARAIEGLNPLPSGDLEFRLRLDTSEFVREMERARRSIAELQERIIRLDLHGDKLALAGAGPIDVNLQVSVQPA